MATKKPDPKRVAAGRRSKLKGKTFEQEVVRRLKRSRIPARRNWQQSGEFAKTKGKKPVLPDVSVDGSRVWLELSSGAKVNPLAKLKQAISDIGKGSACIPIAVTRKKGSPKILATLRLVDLENMVFDALGDKASLSRVINFPVSIDFEDLVTLLKRTN